MSNISARMSLAGLAGLAAALTSDNARNYHYDTPLPKSPPTAAQTARWRDQRGYPQTGSGKRQGARLARQKLDFSASDKCIARIKSRCA